MDVVAQERLGSVDRSKVEQVQLRRTLRDSVSWIGAAPNIHPVVNP